jgi:hypothetical protein
MFVAPLVKILMRRELIVNTAMLVFLSPSIVRRSTFSPLRV